MPTLTGPQLVHASIDPSRNILARRRNEYQQFLELMRRDPTIKMARFLSVAPAVTSSWTIEDGPNADVVPDEARDMLEEDLLSQQNIIKEQSMLGMIDYGWAPFELITDKRWRLVKLKQLLQELTDILVDPDDGEFIGLYQEMTTWKHQDVYLDETAVLYSQNTEGSDWYGHADMESAYLPWNWWNESNESATNYDKKAAGAHWVVTYPLGQSVYAPLGLDPIDNGLIAQDILSKLKSNASVAIPASVQSFVDENAGSNEHPQWTVELKESSTSVSSSFDTRLRYLDSLKVRAFNMPERALIEGQHGTKAEAESHADVAMAYVEMRHDKVIAGTNSQVVDRLLRWHYGPGTGGALRVAREPINSDTRAFLQQLYSKLISSPEGFIQEIDNVDLDSLRDMAGVPTKVVSELI